MIVQYLKLKMYAMFCKVFEKLILTLVKVHNRCEERVVCIYDTYFN